jgi:ADP-heptose:LPS heptosyltransferase
VVSTDSGPYHVAGALGRPLVGLFRHRRPEHADKYAQARVVFGGYQACASECEWDRCAVAECRQMSRISADEVARAVATAVQPRPAETAR